MHIPKTICFNILFITFLLSNTPMMPAACEAPAPTWSAAHPKEPSLIQAVIDDDLEAVVSLLNAEPEIVHQENELGTTAIMAAVLEGPNQLIIGALLRAGANPFHNNQWGCSALSTAIELGYGHIAEDFLAP